ncbi:MAG: 16S rRNA (guanine(527)-N(7))-methyltransferase RsmG [Rickettsiales bacterium]|nr:16S rRNA (guanine(527)-N(7))-methyltransferase RsmG [Rickettsiales bacterium]
MLIEDQKKIFEKLHNVSRETMQKLEEYRRMIICTQKKYNLIGKSTLDKIWIRHFADSAKIFPFVLKYHSTLQQKPKICDVGSGAGFPGIIISVLFQEYKIKNNLSLIDSNEKKCLFLRSVRDKLGLNFEIINQRAEKLNVKYQIIMSRALAPLKSLFPILKNINDKNTFIILHKGENWERELKEIKNKWKFKFNVVKNSKLIDNSGGITIIISNLQKKL